MESSFCLQETNDYDILAESSRLFSFPKHDNVDSIEKSDVEALYTPKSIHTQKTNCDYYDWLILLAPNGKCL